MEKKKKNWSKKVKSFKDIVGHYISMKPIDYSNTIIYKIVSKDLSMTDLYVGHTTNFRKRKCQHKKQCSNPNNISKVYVIIRANGGWESFDMVEVEKYSCNNGNEARARERYWYEILHANMNTLKPFRTSEEKFEQKKKNSQIWKQNHKEQIVKYNKDYKAKYYQDNKSNFALKSKQYRQENQESIKEKRKQYYHENKEVAKEKTKQYCKNNPEKVADYFKTYYQQKKQEILEKNNQKLTCECGKVITFGNKLRHYKTTKHLQLSKKNGDEGNEEL